MALVKEYSNTNSVCKLTFTVSNDSVKSAKEVALLGEFNGWTKNLLKKQKNGTYQTSIELETGKNYAFRYLVDGQYWFNDESADAYVPSGVSNEENSVVVLESVAIEVPKAPAKKVAAPKTEKVVAKKEVAPKVEATPAKKVAAPKVEATPAKKVAAPKVEAAPAKKVATKKEAAPKAAKVVAKKK
jgi:outer membrane biosynthesis protein TonB